MTLQEIKEKYCVDAMSAIEARGIISGSMKGDKKKAEQELNRIYSEWIVHFKTKDGSKYTMKVNGCRNEKEAFSMALKKAVSNGNGNDIDKSSPLKVDYQRKW